MANIYDEENHKYYVDGEEKPGVTDIASPISFERLDNLQKVLLERAKARGNLSKAFPTLSLSSLPENPI